MLMLISCIYERQSSFQPLEDPRNPAFKYVQSRLIWRHIGPYQYGAVGIGKIQIIKWQCSSENYLHSNKCPNEVQAGRHCPPSRDSNAILVSHLKKRINI